jgi:hypothetical protein
MPWVTLDRSPSGLPIANEMRGPHETADMRESGSLG